MSIEAIPGLPLTIQQLNYILDGACIMGSGGGGPYTVGQQVLKKYIGNRQVYLVPTAAVPDNVSMAVSAFVGSPDAAANQALDFSVAATAFTALSNAVGKPFSYVLPGEVGAGNSLIPMAVAVDKGIPVIDAAGAPRAIPGFLMVSYAAAGLPAAPMVLADKNNQVTINCANAIADPVTRGVISGNVFPEDAGIAFWTMNGKTLNIPGNAVKGTTSQAMAIGQALANAIGSGQDPVLAVMQNMEKPNFVLCTGIIKDSSEATSGGFDFGTVVISADDGSEVTIYNQNENLIAFSNRSYVPLAMGPDLICYLTTKGQVFSNADLDTLSKGAKIAVIGVPARVMRSQFILNQFAIALAGIGYAGSYVPIEKLNEERIAA
ncbi:MAG TPA: DUF917 domain-containing protein [Candidatus Angelobacter sp.]